MRTTVELPPELFRAAKARSAARGESLKSLLARAVAAEIGFHSHGDARPRVGLPLFGRPDGPRVNPSSADLERALAEAESRRVGGARRPSGHGRRAGR
jgi:hypothetical protein